MIPLQGCLGEVLSAIALYRLWGADHTALWWTIVGLNVADILFAMTLRECVSGQEAPEVTKFWIIVCMVTQITILGLCVYSFFL